MTTYRIELERVTYHGLSKSVLGGWNYTVKLLGTVECEAESLTEAERGATAKYPKATHIRTYFRNRTGQWEIGCTGSI